MLWGTYSGLAPNSSSAPRSSAKKVDFIAQLLLDARPYTPKVRNCGIRSCADVKS